MAQIIPPEFFGLYGLGSSLSGIGGAIQDRNERRQQLADRMLARFRATGDPAIGQQFMDLSGAETMPIAAPQVVNARRAERIRGIPVEKRTPRQSQWLNQYELGSRQSPEAFGKLEDLNVKGVRLGVEAQEREAFDHEQTLNAYRADVIAHPEDYPAGIDPEDLSSAGILALNNFARWRQNLAFSQEQVDAELEAAADALKADRNDRTWKLYEPVAEALFESQGIEPGVTMRFFTQGGREALSEEEYAGFMEGYRRYAEASQTELYAQHVDNLISNNPLARQYEAVREMYEANPDEVSDETVQQYLVPYLESLGIPAAIEPGEENYFLWLDRDPHVQIAFRALGREGAPGLPDIPQLEGQPDLEPEQIRTTAETLVRSVPGEMTEEQWGYLEQTLSDTDLPRVVATYDSLKAQRAAERQATETPEDLPAGIDPELVAEPEPEPAEETEQEPDLSNEQLKDLVRLRGEAPRGVFRIDRVNQIVNAAKNYLRTGDERSLDLIREEAGEIIAEDERTQRVDLSSYSKEHRYEILERRRVADKLREILGMADGLREITGGS